MPEAFLPKTGADFAALGVNPPEPYSPAKPMWTGDTSGAFANDDAGAGKFVPIPTVDAPPKPRREYMSNPVLGKNYVDAAGNPTGGHAVGPGLSIIWQDGPRKQPDGTLADANGAFVEDAMLAAKQRLEFFQTASGGRFACPENAEAIARLDEAMHALWRRAEARGAAGTLGTHTP